ncbi:MAG: pentapeptide repeat-containing protein, partial [Schlesneria sp.]
LLALLGLRTLASFDGSAEALLSMLSSPTALYKKLVDQTTETSGKVDDTLSSSIFKGGQTLRYLLQRAASMITVLGSEQITFHELNARFAEELVDGNSALERWVERATGDNPFHRLVVNFLFKGGHPDLGCEFLHKSFREYLFAESVVQALVSATPEVPGTSQNGPLPYWQDFAPNTSIHTLSRKLSRLLAPNWMTKEVRGHLFWLLEQEIDKNTSEWVRIRDMLADVYGWWAEGVHLRRQPQKVRGQIQWSEPFINELSIWALPYEQRHMDPQRLASLDAQLGDALMQITAFVHWKLTDKPTDVNRVYQKIRDEMLCFFKPGGKGYFSQLVSRIDVGSTRPLGRRCSGAWLRGVCLDDEVLRCEIFDKSDLQDASMMASKLLGTSFHGADLRRVNMTGADIANADFDEADLSKAEIQEDQLFRRATVSVGHSGSLVPSGYVKRRMATWRDATLPTGLSSLSYGDYQIHPTPCAPPDVWETF